MTDWAMVALTGIYVVATIIICYFNYGSTKAAREQAAEMRRQYEEENRPYITAELIYERKTFYGLRFSNHGKRLANHVAIQLEQTFIDSIDELSFKKALERSQGKECIIGIGQHYDLYFGSNEFRAKVEKKPLAGVVTYQDSGHHYSEEFCIDFESYATFYSINTDTDDFLKEIKSQTKALKEISETLDEIAVNSTTNTEVLETDEDIQGSETTDDTTQ